MPLYQTNSVQMLKINCFKYLCLNPWDTLMPVLFNAHQPSCKYQTSGQSNIKFTVEKHV